jgi:regulator of protease activity HflC (stomatin/prohibitin superfamily)
MVLTALTVLLALAAYVAVAYVLAMNDWCFTFGIEGAAKIVMKKGTFDHAIMWWQGHKLNDPRRLTYDRNQRAWEVLETDDPTSKPSPYAFWQLHWRFLGLFGIYWYGLYPFKDIYVYKFKWTEQEPNEMKPKRRDEYTDFIFVRNFAYWIKLVAAENADNEPLDLDYLLTIKINNPYYALFVIDDWLGRVSADANNAAKMYVGGKTFDEIKREKMGSNNASEFAEHLYEINSNSITQPGAHGTKTSYGVTITAITLVEVSFAGVAREELTRATTAKIIAAREAEAVAETAKGEANAARERAKGQADAARETAKGQADAIEAVYRKVNEFGDAGLVQRELDTLRETANSPNTTYIWANNPIPGSIRDIFRQKGSTHPEAPEAPPAAEPSTP